MNQIKNLVLLLAVLLAFFSFAISYSTLENLAEKEGVNPSALFPLIIDGIIILALIWRLYGQNKDESRLVMAAYVILSIALNAVSHMSILGAIMAAVAPISLFVTSEISACMMRTNTGIKKRDEKGRFVKQTEA